MIRRSCVVTLISILSAMPLAVRAYLPPMLSRAETISSKDELSRLYIAPERVMWVSGDSLVSGTACLLRPTDGQPEMGKKNMCAMTTTKYGTASILLDYGRELHGGLRIISGSAKPWGTHRVRIRFGESVGEACSEIAPSRNKKGYSTNDHAVRDMTLTLPSDGQMEVGNTGYRFVRIDLLDADATIHLKEVSAILRYRDIPYLGSFSCSDSMLTRIWHTGAWTVHLNMQEYLWDGVKRDRLVWLGDMHPEVATIMAVFGQNGVVEKSLDYACRQYPLPQWLNGISSYSLWYLIIQHEWYMRGGDKAFLNRHRDYILGLVDKIDAQVDEDGTEHLEDSSKGALRYFLDWPSSSRPECAKAGHRALLMWAMRDAASLCDNMDDAAHAARCRDVMRRLRQQVLPHLGQKQAASLMAISGLADAGQTVKEVISAGGAQGFSTFYGYYMLQAMALAGEYGQAMDIIKQFWGTMIDLGATTFWEDFNMDWAKNAGRIDEFTPQGKRDIHRDYGAYCYVSYRHSLCHGWASGPTAWLTANVLGVEVMAPGCRTLRITPHLGSLSWAEGTFPTPLGIVSIRHEKGRDGRIKSDIKAPKGIKIIKG